MPAEASRSRNPNSRHRDSKGLKGKNTGRSKPEKEEPNYILDLYCAIYTPEFGNYHHWAFAVFNPEFNNRHIFEVVQDIQDGPFRPVHREANPTNLHRCLRPLTTLGKMHVGWWSTLMRGIAEANDAIGSALSWNCQDYVMEIWEKLQRSGVIDDTTWYNGREQMLPYYGQDFGGNEIEEEVSYDIEPVTREPVSEEFVYDSEHGDAMFNH